MKSIFLMTIMMIAVAMVPFALAVVDADGVDGEDTGDVALTSADTEPILRSGVQMVDRLVATSEPMLAKCITYVKNNNLADDPAVLCGRMLKKELNCAEFLKEKGVEHPVIVCSKLFVTTAQITTASDIVRGSNVNVATIRSRTMLGAAVGEKVADWRLRKIDGVVNKNPGAEAKIEALSDKEAKVFTYLSRAQQENLLKLNNDEMQKRISNYQLVKTKKELVNKKRVIAKEKLLKAEKDFKLAKQNYMKINNEYKDRYSKFVAVKTKLVQCNDSNTTECEELRNQAQEHAKEVVAKSAERLINHLNKIKYSLERAEEINQTRADEIIANIDSAISELENAKTQADGAQTKEEVKEAAATVREIWAKTRHAEQVWRARLVHAKVWGLIKRAEHLEEIFDRSVSKMQEEGINTSAIDEKIDQYSQHISDAHENYKQAEELIKEAYEIRKDNANLTDEQKGEIKTKMTEAQKLVKLVHDDLRKAHKLVVEIAKEIRKSKGKIIKTASGAVDTELAVDEQYEVVDITEEL